MTVQAALLLIIASILALAATLFTLMGRRDEPILGLGALTATLCAALVAVAYTGLGER